MSNQTYTSTGLLNLRNNVLTATVALPNPPIRLGFELTYYNLSKLPVNGQIINVVLCEFTYAEDSGDELATPTSDTFTITLPLATVPKPPGLAGVVDFDFNANPQCLFLFFHSNDANADDRQAFFNDMESFYLNAQKGSYVICPAPCLKGTNPKGKPRAMGPTLI